MKRVLAYVQQFETAFVKREMEKANLKRQTSVEKAKLDIDFRRQFFRVGILADAFQKLPQIVGFLFPIVDQRL